MEKKQILTGLYFIPTKNDATNVFNTVNKIAQQLGYLNCEADDNAAAIKYEGIIQEEHKEKLIKIANENHFTIMFIEAEYETPYADNNTIRIPISNKQS